MNAIHPIAQTDDTVTLRRADFEMMLEAVEDAEDILALRSAEAREKAIGTEAARVDYLPVELVMRLMTGDHPVEDVAFSKKLGIFASQAKWYRNVPAQGVLPDLELTNPSQLTDIVRRANAA